jgi:hypothetical protein
MRWRGRGVAAVVIAAVVSAGCSSTVGGAPRRADAAGGPDRDYGYVDNRCGLLHDETVQQALGADTVVRPYSGAVCQYVLSRGPQMIDATFSWFDTGTLERERALAEDRGATVTDTDVARHQAFLARRDTTGAACAATAAAGGGVLSWWVQYRGQSTDDPCAAAEKLLSATLRSDL